MDYFFCFSDTPACPIFAFCLCRSCYDQGLPGIQYNAILQRNVYMIMSDLLHNHTHQCLNKKFCLCWSIDRYDTDPGIQATYHYGHKISFSFWEKWVRTVECGILAIEENFCESFTNQIILNLFKCAHETHTRKRNLIVNRLQNFNTWG